MASPLVSYHSATATPENILLELELLGLCQKGQTIGCTCFGTWVCTSRCCHSLPVGISLPTTCRYPSSKAVSLHSGRWRLSRSRRKRHIGLHCSTTPCCRKKLRPYSIRCQLRSLREALRN